MNGNEPSPYNGSGFPDDLDFRNTDSLGLQIGDSLTNQLDNSIELSNNGDTTFTMKFENLHYLEMLPK